MDRVGKTGTWTMDIYSTRIQTMLNTCLNIKINKPPSTFVSNQNGDRATAYPIFELPMCKGVKAISLIPGAPPRPLETHVTRDDGTSTVRVTKAGPLSKCLQPQRIAKQSQWALEVC